MKQRTTIEVSIRFLAIYFFAASTPAFAGSARSLLSGEGIFFPLQGLVLGLILSLILPGILWFAAPRLASLITKRPQLGHAKLKHANR